jgi:hypothetical protein
VGQAKAAGNGKAILSGQAEIKHQHGPVMALRHCGIQSYTIVEPDGIKTLPSQIEKQVIQNIDVILNQSHGHGESVVVRR